jgi:hypothetical protein
MFLNKQTNHHLYDIHRVRTRLAIFYICPPFLVYISMDSPHFPPSTSLYFGFILSYDSLVIDI